MTRSNLPRLRKDNPVLHSLLEPYFTAETNEQLATVRHYCYALYRMHKGKKRSNRLKETYLLKAKVIGDHLNMLKDRYGNTGGYSRALETFQISTPDSLEYREIAAQWDIIVRRGWVALSYDELLDQLNTRQPCAKGRHRRPRAAAPARHAMPVKPVDQQQVIERLARLESDFYGQDPVF